MKKVIFLTALLAGIFASQLTNAQIISGRLRLPGFSIGISNAVPYYGYVAPPPPPPPRGDYERQIAIEEDRLSDMKRIAWADGYMSPRERRMIREQEDRIDYMINRRGY